MFFLIFLLAGDQIMLCHRMSVYNIVIVIMIFHQEI